MPALTRLTLPGSASRLLANLDAQTAAQELLDHFDVAPSRSRSSTSCRCSTPLTLLDRVGHPAASATLATLSVSPVEPYLSMMDALEYATQISTSGNLSLLDLESTVRAALADVAGDLKGELVNDS